MMNNRIKTILFSFFLVFSLSKCITTSNAIDSNSSRTEVVSDQRMEVVAFAKEQLGVPYRYGGKDDRGFDCSGFTSFVLKKFDVKISRTSRSQALEGEKIAIDEASPGDLIFFKRSRIGKVFHVAIVVENNNNGLEVIHSTSRGVVIDNITDSNYWNPKIWVAKDVLTDL